LFIEITLNAAKAIINCYNNSMLKLNIQKLSFIIKQSFTAKLLRNYIQKNPFFLNSVTYKIILSLVKILDKIADFIHISFSNIISKSNICAEVKKSVDKKYEFLSIFFIMMAIGFLTGKVILSEADLFSIVVAWIVFFIGCMLMSFNKIIVILKNSTCYKFIKKF